MSTLFGKVSFVLALFFSPTLSHAIGASGVITVEGCHATDSQCFVALDATAGAGCAYGLIYYDLNIAGAKGLKASALAAKLSKKSVSLDYSMDGNRVCRLNYLYQNP